MVEQKNLLDLYEGLTELMADDTLAVQVLRIIDKDKKAGNISPLWDEQIQATLAFLRFRMLFVLKCRQVGMTTIMLALLWLKMYRSEHPKYVIGVGHEDGSVKRMASGWALFGEALPSFLRPVYPVDNAYQKEFGHNGAGFNGIVAGGRGQGRSNTYSDAMFTEVAFWPTGGSAGGRKTDTQNDHDVYQSIETTLHDPDGHIIFESTADGPRGLFYDQFKLARSTPEWGFLFFPWFDCKRYTHPFASIDDRKRFEDGLTEAQQVRRKLYELSLEQLHWYDRLVTVKGYNLMRRRREYPDKERDPFDLDEHGWFDSELLSGALDLIPKGHDNLSDKFQQFHEFKFGHDHVVAVDTSGGVGADFFVQQVFSDRLVQCAVWHDNRTGPDDQAWEVRMVCAKIYDATGLKPYVIVEANKYGRIVIDALAKMKDPPFILWKDEDQKDFYSSGGRAGDTKRKAYSHARQVIDSDWATFSHPDTVRELIDIVERPNGKIEGATGHDDLADGTVLALYAADSLRFRVRGTVQTEKERYRQLRERARHPLGRSS